MAGRSRFVAVEGEGHQETARDPDPILEESEDCLLLPLASEIDADEGGLAVQNPRRRDWPVLTLAVCIVAGWTGFFAWANLGTMEMSGSPALWTQWIGEWASPVLLVGVIWLLAMRNSRQEASRFADSALRLRQEGAALEERLAGMNRELSLAREFLASQSRELETLGRLAIDKLNQHGDRLALLLRDNSVRVETLGEVSSAALENMERLRDHLPVITNVAKDVTNNIGNAGRVAHVHLQEMVHGLARLNEFGQANERHLAAFREQSETVLGALDSRSAQLEGIVGARFEALEKRSAEFDETLARHEGDAIAALKARSEALSQELAATRASLDAEEAESLTSLRARLNGLRDETTTISRRLREGENKASANWQAGIDRLNAQLEALDGEITRRHGAQIEQAITLGNMAEATTARLGEVEARISAITSADHAVANGLSDRLDLLGRTLTETEHALSGLTDSSVRLLELIQSSAQHSRETLPRAIAEGEESLSGFENRVLALRAAMANAVDHGEALARSVDSAQGSLTTATSDLSSLHDGLDARVAEHLAALAQLRHSLTSLEAEATLIAGRSQGELSDAIDKLQGSAIAAVSSLEERGAKAVSAMADRLGTESAEAIEKAMRTQVEETAGQLEQAAAHAAGVSREAAVQLRKQLSKIDELVGNLELRVEQAREKAEEQVDNDFARRAALITETLNSSAIDIAKALDTDVSDTAWAAYLRGDRGIFTRRAVKLLDSAEARSIVQIYEADRGFHEHVNRFIHDFEGMMRQLLSTRDGHALSVTLLSSDMGKLYVALAQSIERLRN